MAVRRVAERILARRRLRGRLVPAAAPRRSSCSTTRACHFDLLLADVVMPGMRGDDLARRAVAMRPGLHVLFMSGYSDNAPPSDLGPTSGRVSFIDKPFDAGALLERLRDLLAA